MESLSGYSFDHVQVHYNSPQPRRIGARAFARAGAIHLAPGQEKHLAHEAWHLVQQGQGRARRAVGLKAEEHLNPERGLEREADTMGEKAMQLPNIAQPLSPLPVPMKPVLQPRLTVDLNDQRYVDRVRAHLNELAGRNAQVRINRAGEVKLHVNKKQLRRNGMDPGHKLLHGLIEHEHTTTIRSAQGADANSSEPVLPDNTIFGKGLDLIKGFQFMRRRGYLTHQARAFVNGSTPGVGVGTVVHYDANMSDEDREGWVRNPVTGETEREVSPQSITLGHELIHSDHFHRGLAAYDDRGVPIKGSHLHTFTPDRGTMTNMEEINTVGLPPLAPNHGFHAHIQNLFAPTMPERYEPQPRQRDLYARRVTEQDLRRQLGLRLRAGYDR